MRPMPALRPLHQALAFALLAGTAAPAAAQQVLYVLSTGNQIARIAQGSPASAGPALLPVAGLVAGDTLVGIDLRPLNGRLYGLGFNIGTGAARLYHLDASATAATATPVGGSIAFDIPISGPHFGFDFNPLADRARVVTSAGQNFRINPNTGAPVDGDIAPGLQMDLAISGATSVVDTAYTNATLNTTATTQYTLSSASDSLYIQNPPNNGVQTFPVAITLDGVPLDFGPEAGFDIPFGINVAVSNTAATGSALAALSVGGVSGLYRVRLEDGVATLVGSFGAVAVRDITLGPATGSAAVLNSTGPVFSRFRPETPGTTTTVAVGGVAAGETMVGIDGRPATGQMYGLGINGIADTATLYLIDPQTGSATAVGATGGITLAGGSIDLAATSWGFDFNPAVDRIRVINSNGLNFRLNPNDGTVVDSDANGANGATPDAAINGAAVALSGAAYASNTPPTIISTLYTLDPATDRIYLQNNANAGTQTAGRQVTAGGIPIDFDLVAGFDIPPGAPAPAANAEAPGLGYAVMSSGGSTQLYGIDLPSGAVQQVLGAVAAGATPFEGLVAWNGPIYRVFADGFEN